MAGHARGALPYLDEGAPPSVLSMTSTLPWVARRDVCDDRQTEAGATGSRLLEMSSHMNRSNGVLH